MAGVKTERFQNASTTIRHCALSLVGEPIMYPEINALLQGMHRERISTFLVGREYKNEISMFVRCHLLTSFMIR